MDTAKYAYIKPLITGYQVSMCLKDWLSDLCRNEKENINY